MINEPVQQKRLLSLDFMRGLIMVLLMLESTRLFDHLATLTSGTFAEHVVIQFFHHPWNGLRFWDIVQPGFMFIAGTAMAYSLHHQHTHGMSWANSFIKVLKRSGWLFFFGVLDYAVHPEGLSFELWDVLTQLSFTTLIAFLIFQWPVSYQLLFSFGLLLLTEVLYRFTSIPGYDMPFTDQNNFGNYMDLILMNKVNDGGWVAINFLPTAAHTIWGVLAGKLLLSAESENKKAKWIFVCGLIGVTIGYLMNFTITPIIKRIATSSFTIASGGWCLIMLALCYWWIDVKDHRQRLNFFTIVGMNSLFIYLFFEIIGHRWFNNYIGIITQGLLDLIHTPETIETIITSLVIFLMEWGLCFFLYKRGIFFKI